MIIGEKRRKEKRKGEERRGKEREGGWGIDISLYTEKERKREINLLKTLFWDICYQELPVNHCSPSPAQNVL